MSDTPDTGAPRSNASSFGFLTRKLGPMPVWLWVAIIIGAYYWYTHYGPGASKTGQTGQAGTSSGPISVVQRGVFKGPHRRHPDQDQDQDQDHDRSPAPQPEGSSGNTPASEDQQVNGGPMDRDRDKPDHDYRTRWRSVEPKQTVVVNNGQRKAGQDTQTVLTGPDHRPLGL